jgi:hypothetical protein
MYYTLIINAMDITANGTATIANKCNNLRTIEGNLVSGNLLFWSLDAKAIN